MNTRLRASALGTNTVNGSTSQISAVALCVASLPWPHCTIVRGSMVDYTKIAQRLMRHGLTPDQAWSAISRAYIACAESGSTSVNEAQAAQYIFVKALGWHWNWVTKPTLIERAVEAKTQEYINRSSNLDEAFSEDELFVAPPEDESDADYMAAVLQLVPQAYRVPVLCVIQAILKRPPTKPLSVEACRKILQKCNIPNTSEYARQVYTFLTTFKGV